MASKILACDGTSLTTEDKMTLQEMQNCVAGYIELVRTPNHPSKVLVVNEEGRIDGDPYSKYNEQASMYAGQPIYGQAILMDRTDLD